MFGHWTDHLITGGRWVYIWIGIIAYSMSIIFVPFSNNSYCIKFLILYWSILRLVKEEDADCQTELIFKDHPSTYLQLDTHIHRRPHNLLQTWNIKFIWEQGKCRVVQAKQRNEVMPKETPHKWREKARKPKLEKFLGTRELLSRTTIPSETKTSPTT